MKLTHEHLLERLDYNPKTGDLIWKKRFPIDFKPGNTSSEANCRAWNKRYANKTAGAIRKEDGVDHKNRIKDNNWIDNLREAGKQCNARNTGMISTNTSGVKGVSFCKKAGKWRSYVKVNNEYIGLGYSGDFDEVVLKRWKAEVKYKFPNCCSDSSAYNYLKENDLI